MKITKVLFTEVFRNIVKVGKYLLNCYIEKYFKGIFISGEIGINTPDRGFFEACFAAMEDFAPTKTMIVGDSLSSDIQGGKNAGIVTCWVNPAHKTAPAGLQPDYQIENLTQLETLLETL